MFFQPTLTCAAKSLTVMRMQRWADISHYAASSAAVIESISYSAPRPTPCFPSSLNTIVAQLRQSSTSQFFNQVMYTTEKRKSREQSLLKNSSAIFLPAEDSSHTNPVTGSPRMVDITEKKCTHRVAAASAKVQVSSALLASALFVQKAAAEEKVDILSGDFQSNAENHRRRDEKTADSANMEVNGHEGTQNLSFPKSTKKTPLLRTRKGDVFSVAELAGIMAAKQTSSLLPLCHNIPLSSVEVVIKVENAEQLSRFDEISTQAGATKITNETQNTSSHRRQDAADNSTGRDIKEVMKAQNHSDPFISIRSCVKSQGRTGVEMEALTAVSIAALTVYDMCKGIDKNIRITDVKLISKSGGKINYDCNLD